MKQLEIILNSTTDKLQYQSVAHKLIALLNYKHAYFAEASDVEYVGNSMRFTLNIPGVCYKVIIDIFDLFARVSEMARASWEKISCECGSRSDGVRWKLYYLRSPLEKFYQLHPQVYWFEWNRELSLATIDSLMQRKGLKVGSSDAHNITYVLQTYLLMLKLAKVDQDYAYNTPASFTKLLTRSDLCEQVYQEAGLRYLRKTRTFSLVHVYTDAVLFAISDLSSIMGLFDPQLDYLSMIGDGCYDTCAHVQILREFITLLWSMPLTMFDEQVTVGGIF